jgi:hypothetical protein
MLSDALAAKAFPFHFSLHGACASAWHSFSQAIQHQQLLSCKPGMRAQPRLYPVRFLAYTSIETMPSFRFPFLNYPGVLAALCLLAVPGGSRIRAQDTVQKPVPKTEEKPATPEVPARIEILETNVRFEAEGSSRKEVHALVKINNELGVQQFARLNFDYNRAFESIEIPLVRVTHASGGTVEILPSAITDVPNPAVVHAPVYQDVRVKSVRILGLQPGDTLEYRVITTVSHAPLAPEFYFAHSFDHAGLVSQESFTLDIPSSRKIQITINPSTPAASIEHSGEADSARTVYRWQISPKAESADEKTAASEAADVAFTTFSSWGALSTRLQAQLKQPAAGRNTLKKAAELTESLSSFRKQVEAVYDFVSQKIALIDLPLDATGYRARTPDEILSAGYGTQEDKFALLNGLLSAFDRGAVAVLASASDNLSGQPPRPSLFTHMVVQVLLQPPPEFLVDSGRRRAKCPDCGQVLWVDPTLEVAPMGMIPSNFRGKLALKLGLLDEKELLSGLVHIPRDLPFPASQKVNVNASLAADGKLTAKVHYALRGDNELLLRIAFHQTPREKWTGLAQLLSISDGFRGKIISVSASDPMATHESFTVDYEITTPKFVDWSKKPVRIPALLPQVGLPDPPAKTASGAATAPIDLGTPLEVETRATLHIPSGTTAHTPAGIAVERDYATFSSKYSDSPSAITASRHINFLLREVPAARAADYNAFLRAVQNDSAQEFTLIPPDLPPAKATATPKKSRPAKPRP